MTCIYQRPTTNLYVSKSCYHHICNSLFTDRFAQWLEAQSLQGTAHFLYVRGENEKIPKNDFSVNIIPRDEQNVFLHIIRFICHTIKM